MYSAIKTAQDALAAFLRDGTKSYGITLRYYEGRWNIYSFDVAGWHILLSDNGGRLVYAFDCSRIG